MGDTFENQLERYLQGNFHPEVAPLIRREIRLGTVSVEGFLRLADVFHANHEALDEELADQGMLTFEDTRVDL